MLLRDIQVANIESCSVPKPFHGILRFLGLIHIISALFVLFADQVSGAKLSQDGCKALPFQRSRRWAGRAARPCYDALVYSLWRVRYHRLSLRSEKRCCGRRMGGGIEMETSTGPHESFGGFVLAPLLLLLLFLRGSSPCSPNFSPGLNEVCNLTFIID